MEKQPFETECFVLMAINLVSVVMMIGHAVIVWARTTRNSTGSRP